MDWLCFYIKVYLVFQYLMRLMSLHKKDRICTQLLLHKVTMLISEIIHKHKILYKNNQLYFYKEAFFEIAL